MKKENRRGFTLIELLAVIIILGILLLLAIPGVTKYIERSRLSTYKTNLASLVDSVRNEVNSLEDEAYNFATNEYLVVPLTCVDLEKGIKDRSPFGNYIHPNSFVLVTRNLSTKAYEFYVSAKDEMGYGTEAAPVQEMNVEKLSAGALVGVIDEAVNLGAYDFVVEGKTRKLVECTSLSYENPSADLTGITDVTERVLNSNIIRDDSNVDFTKTSSYGADYVERVATEKTTYTFDTDREFWFGNDYSFDKTTGKYTIVGGTQKNWATTDPTNYKYFCATTQQVDTCNIMYEMDDTSETTSSTVTGYVHDAVANETVDNGNGLFRTGDIYYFRGNVRNNYVKFGTYSKKISEFVGYYSETDDRYKNYESLEACQAAETYNYNCTEIVYANAGDDMLWKIVRINSDSTMRVVLADSIGKSKFNSSSGDNAYLGYMYGTAGATTYEAAHANTNNSVIKTMLETWYADHLLPYASYISDSGFCNDRSLHTQNGYEAFDTTKSIWASSGLEVNDTGLGYGTNYTYYGGFYRVYYGNPSFDCINDNDLFTVDPAKGNGKLTYPIGLLTVDEATYAGGKFDQNNSSYYLYLARKPWWTMSPGMYIATSGASRTAELVGVTGIYYNNVVDQRHVRPVINLVTEGVEYTGRGTIDDPYTIVTGA